MDEPEQWRWIWLGAALLFGLGEMATPGAFFLAPFAVGAVVASALAFAGVAVGLEWAAFVAVSLGAFVALRPLARRLDRHGGTEGVGSRRLIGRPALVLEAIAPGHPGLVRVDREEWRADAADRSAIAEGSEVRVTDVQGTRVIVTLDKEHLS
ncbi:MAG TPA: NfeD family protein [Acidimicrobiales bacterium]|jgi:membrane protein implicated in regulation of membrane protease activity|nr:NfeD family protein [Acidimicrobiales bacterium]